MNKLRNLKNRSQNVLTIGGGTSSATPSPTTSSSPNGSSSSSSMFTKLSKRYANVKFLRQPPGRQGGAVAHHQATVSTGSYDLTTAELKREIGAPILISKTCIDMDTTDCRIAPGDQHKSLPTSPTVHTPDPVLDDGTAGATRFDYADAVAAANPLGQPCGTSTVLRKSRSKSASNLHKSELRVFLQRAPSLKLGETASSDDIAADDTPEADRTYHIGGANETRNNRVNSHANSREPRALSSGSAPTDEPRQHRKSTSPASSSVASATYANTGPAPPAQMRASTPQSTTYGSKDSLNVGGAEWQTPRRTAASSRSSREPSTLSRDSLAGEDEPDGAAAFAAKCNPASAYQTLDARDLFRSIEELNAITRQLNEVDDSVAGADDHREYCEHRDNLRPDQRRITLLRNKGQSVLNLNVKREKLGHAWSGLKNWIGEEGGRIKEVVNKHAALQRVGALSTQQPHVEEATGRNVDLAAERPEAVAAVGAEEEPAINGFLQTLVRKGSKQSTSSTGTASDVEVKHVVLFVCVSTLSMLRSL